MKSIVTRGIVLSRTNFGEADRILTILTPDQGKLSLIAKGVRKSKSKLAAGVELFSTSFITFIPPKKDVGTLVSSRLDEHYGNIVKDLDRTNAAYDVLKRVNRLTEPAVESDFFTLTHQALQVLNVREIPLQMFQLWLSMRLLQITGHAPNLDTDNSDNPLVPNELYTFDFDTMSFAAHKAGMFGPDHIKLLRLVVKTSDPTKLAIVQGTDNVLPACQNLAQSMVRESLHI